jgi:hypothetical protein
MKANASAPTRARPVRIWLCPDNPSSSSAHMPTKEPIMNTLKCAKLISSMMPYTSVNPMASKAYMAPRLTPLITCCKRTA